jgi:hypothetical protein
LSQRSYFCSQSSPEPAGHATPAARAATVSVSLQRLVTDHTSVEAPAADARPALLDAHLVGQHRERPVEARLRGRLVERARRLGGAGGGEARRQGEEEGKGAAESHAHP